MNGNGSDWDALWSADVVVVGGGAAGLSSALGVASGASQPRILLLTKGVLGESGSSPLAQGGIAAAVGEDDSPELHAADTERVGRGLNDIAVVRVLTDEGPARVAELLSWGARFDRQDEELALGQEAGHRRRRILHAGGDQTGAEIMRALKEQVAVHPSIRVEEDFFAVDLVTTEPFTGRRVVGVWGFSGEDRVSISAQAMVLATGGLGQLFQFTTNPPEVTGDGMAMAARAGARLVDLEFVQFHPTALAPRNESALDRLPPGATGMTLPLLTEALRGEGAWLVGRRGTRFMLDVHPDGELAPRDIVARTLFLRAQQGEPSYLDLREMIAGSRAPFAERFPTAARHCAAVGLDPQKEPIPVTPAAHYMMGGVEVDMNGGTSLKGLWACGEVTSSGAHGANRLASNSLLEGLVFGHLVAKDLLSRRFEKSHGSGEMLSAPPVVERDENPKQRLRLQKTMWDQVGLVRNEEGLTSALEELDRIERRLVGTVGELNNLLLCARMVTAAALERRESRGAHYRSDFSQSSAAWRRRLSFDLATLLANRDLGSGSSSCLAVPQGQGGMPPRAPIASAGG